MSSSRSSVHSSDRPRTALREAVSSWGESLSVISQLTKARLSLLVLWTTAVGYLLALGSGGAFDMARFVWTLLGTALAAASANALNQVIERRRDAAMARTQGRPIPSGLISTHAASILALTFGLTGIALLALRVNLLVGWLAAFTIALYVGLYTPLKTRTTLNTFVGAICGATPPMIGWAAVTGGLETGAWILAAILFVWQLPHFLALAWLYRHDYTRGGFVMLPAVDASGEVTSRIVLLTSLLLVPLGLMASLAGLAGWIYAIGSIGLGVVMLAKARRLMGERTDASARGVFLTSIVYLATLLMLLVIDSGPDGPLVGQPAVQVALAGSAGLG